MVKIEWKFVLDAEEVGKGELNGAAPNSLSLLITELDSFFSDGVADTELSASPKPENPPKPSPSWSFLMFFSSFFFPSTEGGCWDVDSLATSDDGSADFFPVPKEGADDAKANPDEEEFSFTDAGLGA